MDPLGGSYFLESLTDRLEDAAEAYFDKIASFGGMVRAIEAGYPQKEIIDSSNRFQHAVEQEEQIIVGVNEYVEPDESDIEMLRIGPAIERAQINHLGDSCQ